MSSRVHIVNLFYYKAFSLAQILLLLVQVSHNISAILKGILSEVTILIETQRNNSMVGSIQTSRSNVDQSDQSDDLPESFEVMLAVPMLSLP